MKRRYCISRLARMFDREFHKEYLFRSCLLRLIPGKAVTLWNLKNCPKLGYCRLEKAFGGAIAFGAKRFSAGVGETKKAIQIDSRKDPLEEVIRKINEAYKGNFTENNRVITATLMDKLRTDKKLRKSALSNGQRIFERNVFPKIFDAIAQAAYMEQVEAYTQMFEDKAKYLAIRNALAQDLYRELRNAPDAQM